MAALRSFIIFEFSVDTYILSNEVELSISLKKKNEPKVLLTGKMGCKRKGNNVPAF